LEKLEQKSVILNADRRSSVSWPMFIIY